MKQRKTEETESKFNSFELLKELKSLSLLEHRDEYWWEGVGTFETFLGSILTQNTKWTNVEKSLQNLKNIDALNINSIHKIDLEEFIIAIAPSGFKNQKSKRIKQICSNILSEFQTFENFKHNVDRQWLLKQIGIGPETADSILCYVCMKPEMVVDSYTKRLLLHYDLEFKDYEQLKAWCEYGIKENYDKIIELYGYEISLNKIYARFHGKIVEYMKKGKTS